MWFWCKLNNKLLKYILIARIAMYMYFLSKLFMNKYFAHTNVILKYLICMQKIDFVHNCIKLICDKIFIILCVFIIFYVKIVFINYSHNMRIVYKNGFNIENDGENWKLFFLYVFYNIKCLSLIFITLYRNIYIYIYRFHYIWMYINLNTILLIIHIYKTISYTPQ